ncbi:MAG: hypothetical protein KKF58_06655 [Gammaproteobacteria bacterium]|nr:hypothetical protein [Gammaproteobacteria bacterium]MBU1447975.1 hypothetical protein [Gammaproteobacteria bacterium]
MTSRQRTMQVVSYGICRPQDLFEKLKRDAAKLTAQPNPDDVFNFLITAASLYEWMKKFFKDVPLIDEIAVAVEKRNWESFPQTTTPWLADIACVPNVHLVERHHIINALQICWVTAGASKHFIWNGDVKDVQPEPIVDDWYQYFFSSVEPDLYVDYDDEAYGLSQIRSIILQFYEKLFCLIEKEAGGADAQPDN